METLFRIASRWPLSALHAVGWLGGWLVFLASATYRRRFLDNVAQAGIPKSQWLAAVGQSGMMVAELPRLWLGRPAVVRWTGVEHVEAALNSGRGLMVLTPHLGCFEIVGRSYMETFGVRQPMTALFRSARRPWFGAMVLSGRQRSGLRVVPTNMGGVKQLLKVLRAGQTVGLLPDQVPPQALGVWAPFFGKPAYTMTLAARLAQQTGVVVLLAWGERLPWGRGYVVHVETMARNMLGSTQEAVIAVNEAMEGLIRQRPQQYLWGYERFKQPRETQTAGASSDSSGSG